MIAAPGYRITFSLPVPADDHHFSPHKKQPLFILCKLQFHYRVQVLASESLSPRWQLHNMAFDLSPALEADIPQLAQLWQSSFRSYDIWTAAMHDVSSEDELAFYNKALTRRMKLPNTFTTKVTERETK